MDIGTGAWDSQRRPSEVRLNRLLRIEPAGVRREGAALGCRAGRRLPDHVEADEAGRGREHGEHRCQGEELLAGGDEGRPEARHRRNFHTRHTRHGRFRE
jgi:hypothetical protein